MSITASQATSSTQSTQAANQNAQNNQSNSNQNNQNQNTPHNQSNPDSKTIADSTKPLTLNTTSTDLHQKNIERNISNSSGNSSPVIVSARATPSGGNSPILESTNLPIHANSASHHKASAASATASATSSAHVSSAATATVSAAANVNIPQTVAAKSKSDSQSSSPVIVSPLDSARRDSTRLDSARKSASHSPSAAVVHVDNLTAHISDNHMPSSTMPSSAAAFSNALPPIHPIHPASASKTPSTLPSAVTLAPPAQVKSGGTSPEANKGSPIATVAQGLSNVATHASNIHPNVKSDKDSSASATNASTSASEALLQSQSRRFSVGGAWVSIPSAALLQTNQPQETDGSGSGSLVSTPQGSARASEMSFKNASGSPVSSSKPSNAAAAAKTADTAVASTNTALAAKKEGEINLSHSAKGSPLVCVVVTDETGNHAMIESVPNIPLEPMYFKRESEGVISPTEGQARKTNNTAAETTTTASSIEGQTQATSSITKSNSTSALTEMGSGSSNDNSRDTSPRNTATGIPVPSRSILRADVPPLNMQAAVNIINPTSKGILPLAPSAALTSSSGIPSVNSKAASLSTSAAVSQSISADTKLAAELGNQNQLSTDSELEDDLKEIKTQLNDFQREKDKLSLTINAVQHELILLRKSLEDLQSITSETRPIATSTLETGPIFEILGQKQNNAVQDSKSPMKDLEKKIASKELMLKLWQHSLETVEMNITIFTQSISERSSALSHYGQKTANTSNLAGAKPLAQPKSEIATQFELERLKKEQARLALAHSEEAERLKQTVSSLQAEKNQQIQLHEKTAKNLKLQLESLQAEHSTLSAQLGAKNEQINKQTSEINQLMTQKAQQHQNTAQELAKARAAGHAAGSAAKAAEIRAFQQKVI